MKTIFSLYLSEDQTDLLFELESIRIRKSQVRGKTITRNQIILTAIERYILENKDQKIQQSTLENYPKEKPEGRTPNLNASFTAWENFYNGLTYEDYKKLDLNIRQVLALHNRFYKILEDKTPLDEKRKVRARLESRN